MLRKLMRRQLDQDCADGANSDEPRLIRTMGLMSLTFLGVSNSVGSGVYVLTGIASNPHAGPYVALSYVLAGVACLFSAFCYAEFSSRVKDTSGSSYSFIYYSLGEFAAYVTGWMLFTGAIASISATAITWSSYVNAFTNDTIKNFVINEMHCGWDFDSPFSSYLDISAIGITIIMFIVALGGVEFGTVLNNILALINILLLVVITIGGFIYGSWDNLKKPEYENGLNGILKGSSIVFYALIGFESSTFAINEAKNPGRNIPLSLIFALIIMTISYCGASLSLNLMQPWDQIDTVASYPTAFKSIGWMHTVVSIGPIVSLSAVLFIGTYSIARMAYSMSKDGLVFKYLSAIHPKTKIPHLATYTSLVLTLALTVLFDVQNLIGFANIAGFLTYSVIGVGLLIVRYYHDDNYDILNNTNTSSADQQYENLNIFSKLTNKIQNICSEYKFFQQKNIATALIVYIFFSNILFFGLLNYVNELDTVFLIVCLASNLLAGVTLGLFKQTDKNANLSFKVPLVPLLPILVIMMNNYLLMSCDLKDWIIFAVIMVAGLPIYFFYGIKNSKLTN